MQSKNKATKYTEGGQNRTKRGREKKKCGEKGNTKKGWSVESVN